MSRRPQSPLQRDKEAYLSAVAGSGFIAVSQDRKGDENGARASTRDAPPYASTPLNSAPNDKKGPRTMPSSQPYDFAAPTQYHLSPFSRPDDGQSVRSEGVFNFSDDRSIMPEDSVSQLQRGFTGKKPLGPRAMQPLSTMHEQDVSDEISFVPTPDMIKLEGPEVVPKRGLYAHHEDEEDDGPVESYRSVRESQNSQAHLPLVQDAAPMAGYDQYRSTQPEEQHDEYAQWRNQDLEHAPRGQYNQPDNDDKKSFFGFNGPLSTPMAYIRSISSGGQHSNYPPTPRPDAKGEFIRPGEDPSQLQPAPLWKRMFWDTTPMARRKYERQHQTGLYKYGYACYILAIAMTVTLIIELVRMSAVTGKPIQTKPSFNVMIGPSGEMLINLGARFAGCMKFVPNVSDIDWVCLKSTNQATITAADATCTMSDICGFGGFPAAKPDQSFRFVLPIFLHAGVIHLIVNMLVQLTTSAFIETQMGAPKFLILYFLSGIFGFVLGSNFALVGQPSVGASGAIFGTNAAFLVDLVAHWSLEDRPKRKLFWLVVEMVIGFGLGYVPGIDNFAHIGGFCMGLLCSIVLLPVVAETRVRKVVWIVLRIAAAALVVVLLAVLVRNFYDNDPNKMCTWCRYLSCWPTAANNRCKGTGITTIQATSSALLTALASIVGTHVISML